MGNSIIARLGLDSADFKRELSTIKPHLESVKNEVGKIGTNIQSAFAGTLTVGAITAAGSAIIEFASNLADTSEALGINVETLQELQYAFGQSGASAEVVNKGLTKLGMNQQEARDGNLAMVATFEALGVTWAEINTLSPDEVLMRIAASSGEATDPTQRLNLIIEAMGKSGAKMAAGLNGGVDSIRALRAEADKLSEPDVKILDDAGDMISRFKNKLLVYGAKELLLFKQQMQNPLGSFGDFAPGEKPTEGVPEYMREAAAGDAPIRTDKGIEESMIKEAKAFATILKHQEEMEEAGRGTALQMSKLADEFLEQKKKDAEELLEFEKKQYAEFCRDREQKQKQASDQAKELAEQENNTRKKFADMADKKTEENLAGKIQDAADPGGKAERRRAARREDTLRKRAVRDLEREERGGRSAADAEADTRPLSERVKAKGVGRGSMDPRENRAADLANGLADGRKNGPGGEFKSALDEAKIPANLQKLADNYGASI